jgi:hypothetical protein
MLWLKPLGDGPSLRSPTRPPYAEFGSQTQQVTATAIRKTGFNLKRTTP